MNNKKMFTKLAISAVLVWWFGLSLASSASIKMNVWGLVWLSASRVSPIHFADNWNDFWGLIYFSNVGEDTLSSGEFSVIAWGLKYTCDKQVRWFYYDAQRGERLWPLDESTKNVWGMDELDITGGFYTRCLDKEAYDSAIDTECSETEGDENTYNECVAEQREKYADTNWFYGMIEHSYNDEDFTLIAWVEYQTWDSWKWITIKQDSVLAPSFQRYSNDAPVGFVYDYNGWVGFVGCEVSWNTDTKQSTLNKLVALTQQSGGISACFTLNGNNIERSWWLCPSLYSSDLNCTGIWSMSNSLIWLLVEWLVGMGKNNDISSLEWNQWKTSKMQYFSSANVNSATMINYVRQKAEILCRGKWQNAIGGAANIQCIQNANVDLTSQNFNWTLIVKNGNVKVKPSESAWDSMKYDIFIDQGDLEIVGGGDMYVIQSNWFVNSGMTVGQFNDAVSSSFEEHKSQEGRESINYEYSGPNVAVARVLNWNFIVNGKVTWSNLNDKYFIYGKFTSLDTYDDIAEKFTWRCGNEGKWSDGNYCPASSELNQHPYQTASLVVIDQNYDSPLFW